MGNSIAKNVASAMAERQRENQKEMAKQQRETMLRAQDRQMKIMLATQIAMARERCWWLGGVWLLAATGVGIGLAKRASSAKFALVPFTAFTVFMAYNIDLAYWTKGERIYNMRNKILNDPTFWYIALEKDEHTPNTERVLDEPPSSQTK